MPDSDSKTQKPQICTEDEFRLVLWERMGPLTGYGRYFRAPTTARGVRAYSLLAEEAFDLVSFLDHYGARANEAFGPLTELVASLRGFAIMGATLGVLSNRVGHNYPDEAQGSDPGLAEAIPSCEGFVDQSIDALIDGILEEASGAFDGKLPGGEGYNDRLDQGLPPMRLPTTVGHGEIADQESRVAEMASKFLAHKQILDRESADAPFEDATAMTKYILEVSDEPQCRYFETRIHTVLSRYDLFVRGTTLEPKDPDLAVFRSYLAVTRHLCRIMTELVHFYESHEDDVRSEAVRKRISAMVSKGDVARYAVAFSLRYMRIYTDAAGTIAQRLLRRYTRHGRVTCTVPDGVQFHVRPVSLIAKIVQHHGTPVTMFMGDESCYAGSIVQMLMATGSLPQDREVSFEGDRSALEDIQAFFSSGLGEFPDQPLPSQLSYLGLS